MSIAWVGSEKMDPDQENFQKTIDGKSDSEEIWKLPSTRSMTDVLFLIIMTAFLTFLCFLLGYCILNGNIFRIINGYDNCGNICGKSNSILRNSTVKCSESNADKPFHLVKIRPHPKIKDRYCVKNCSDFEGYRKFFNRCIPNKTHKTVDKFIAKTGIRNFFQEVAEDFHLCYNDILVLCLISLLLSLLLMVGFRFLVGCIVWCILIGVIIACFAASTWLWILWKTTDDSHDNIKDENLPVIESRKNSTLLAYAIASTIVTIIVILVIYVLRKRIQIVSEIFKESGKALAAMPTLIILPLLTFFCLTMVISLWFFFSLWIESSGRLVQASEGIYHYDKDGLMRFTRWYCIFAVLWEAQFLIGCQHMVIAGAVSNWYFTRDKSKLSSPIYQSFFNLLRFHLGSVALGSLIIAFVQFLRIILKFVQYQIQRFKGKCAEYALQCCQCCLCCFEKILKFLTRNAYIEVAMVGCSFCKGGKRAFRLLVTNAMKVIAINSVGDFILFLGKVIVVVATALIGIVMLKNKEGLQHMWVPVTLAGVFAYFIAHCFMTVYEMIIDTIFLCFCEDCEKNDGIERPYFMSRSLMTLVENSKKVIKLHDHRQYQASQRIAEVSPSNEKIGADPPT